jgi:hypothetical protein
MAGPLALSKRAWLKSAVSFIVATLSVLMGAATVSAQEFNFDRGHNDEAALAQLAVMLVVYGVIFLVAVAILIFVCFLLYTILSAVPPQFRLMEPGMVWLLLIPLFSMVWMFFVYIRISKSYQAYFRSIGRYDVGDCGEQIGLWYCICTVSSLIPCVGGIAGMVGFVLMIIYLVQLWGLKNQLLAITPPKWGGPM